jgi:HK97 family phage prohead protease
MPSTESQDRDGDVLVATGADLENYRRNPVVMYAHDYTDLPVAKALEIEAVPGVGLRAKIQFPEPGVNPKADAVRGLWAGGFLNAASVGFVPRASTPEGKGARFTAWELLEFSIVPVPANADALRLAVKSMEPDDTLTKRGRVLSATNERRIREAVASLSDVLAQLGEQPQAEPESAEPADTKQVCDEGAVADIAAALSELPRILKEYLK